MKQNQKQLDLEYYTNKVIKIVSYFLVYYFLIALSRIGNIGLASPTIFSLLFVLLFFQIQYHVRKTPLMSLITLGIYVLFQISSLGTLCFNFINYIIPHDESSINLSFVLPLFARILLLTYGVLAFYYTFKIIELNKERESIYGTLDEDEVIK